MSNNLVKDDISSLFKNLAIPASVGMVFSTMFNVIDTYFAGRISTEAIAALSFSFYLYFMFLSFAFGINIAITALVGNLRGNNKHSYAKLFSSNGLSISLIFSLLSVGIAYLYSFELLVFLGAKGIVLELALEYLYVIFIGTAFLMPTFAINAILVSTGDTKSMRNSLFFGMCLNVILTPLFIYGYGFIPPFGFAGLALSTVLIQIMNFSYMAYKVSQTDLIDFRKLKYFIPIKSIYNQIFKQAIPAFFNMFSMSIGHLVAAYFVALYGFEAMAAYGIGMRVEQLMLLPILGISTAMLTIVSNNYGAKQYSRIRECIKIGLFYGYSISLLSIFIFYFFGEMIVSIFDNNKIVVTYAYEYVFIESITFFAYVTIFISVSVLQGIKTATIIAYISFYRQIIAPIILFYLVVIYYTLDLYFMWLAILITMFSAAIFYLWYMFKRLNTLDS